MEKGDIEFLQRVMEQISQSALEFGKAIVPILQKFRDEMSAYYKIIYPVLRKEYESAGCPYGSDDESMWTWLRGKAQFKEESDRTGLSEDDGGNWAKDVLKLKEYLKQRIN